MPGAIYWNRRQSNFNIFLKYRRGNYIRYKLTNLCGLTHFKFKKSLALLKQTP